MRSLCSLGKARRCARSAIHPQEAAQSASPSSPPEVEDAAAGEASVPPQHPTSAQPAAVTHPDVAAAVQAMDIDTTGKPDTDSAQVAQRLAPQSGAAVASEVASSVSRHGAAKGSVKQKQGSAKPSYIARGPRLVRRSAVPKAHAFADASSVKAALADAWSSDSDVGKQLAALYELFGDSILPYVPMLPCMSSSGLF